MRSKASFRLFRYSLENIHIDVFAIFIQILKPIVYLLVIFLHEIIKVPYNWLIVFIHERNCGSGIPAAAGSSDFVDIILYVRRQIEVNNVRYFGEIQASACDVSRNQD